MIELIGTISTILAITGVILSGLPGIVLNIEMFTVLGTNWVEIVGVISTILAVSGVLLNNRKMRFCFIIWIFSNSLSLIIHAQTSVWSLVVRDGIFFILAVEGWIKWGKKA